MAKPPLRVPAVAAIVELRWLALYGLLYISNGGSVLPYPLGEML